MSSSRDIYYFSQSQSESQPSSQVVFNNSVLPTILEHSSQASSKTNEIISLEDELRKREEESERIMYENLDNNAMEDYYDPDEG